MHRPRLSYLYPSWSRFAASVDGGGVRRLLDSSIRRVCASAALIHLPSVKVGLHGYRFYRVYRVFRVYRVYRVSRSLEPWQAWTTLLSDVFLNSCRTRRAFIMHFHEMERFMTRKTR